MSDVQAVQQLVVKRNEIKAEIAKVIVGQIYPQEFEPNWA